MANDPDLNAIAEWMAKATRQAGAPALSLAIFSKGAHWYAQINQQLPDAKVIAILAAMGMSADEAISVLARSLPQ